MRILFLILIFLNLGYYLYNFKKADHPGETNGAINHHQKSGVQYLKVIPVRKFNSSGTPFKRKNIPSKDKALEQNRAVAKNVLVFNKKPLVASKIINVKPSGVTGSVKTCYTFGPIFSGKIAQDVDAYLKGKALRVVMRHETKKSVSAYWVYLKSYRTTREATFVAAMLKKDSVKQYFIVHAGQYKNAISLGLYKNKADATRRFNKIHALGYSPHMMVQYSNQLLYWVDYEKAKPNAISLSNILGTQSTQENPKQMHHACPVG